MFSVCVCLFLWLRTSRIAVEIKLEPRQWMFIDSNIPWNDKHVFYERRHIDSISVGLIWARRAAIMVTILLSWQKLDLQNANEVNLD